MVQLRMHVLLDPIGIPRHYINAGKEADDLLVAAFEEGQLVGCCILMKLDESSVQLRQMAVANNIQKKGIGTALISFAEKVAKDHSYKRIKLHARNGVIGFYKKNGYIPFDEPFEEIGIPHQKMEKYL